MHEFPKRVWGKTTHIFHTCSQCSPPVLHLLTSQLGPVFFVLVVLLLQQGGFTWGLRGVLHLTVQTFCSACLCCLPGTVFLRVTSGGDTFPGVLLGEIPSHMFFPRAPRTAWGFVPSIGMMPLDEGGSETESLYEIEGMNKWILYL